MTHLVLAHRTIREAIQIYEAWLTFLVSYYVPFGISPSSLLPAPFLPSFLLLNLKACHLLPECLES